MIASRARDSVTAASGDDMPLRSPQGRARYGATSSRVPPAFTFPPDSEHRSSCIDVNSPLAGGA